MKILTATILGLTIAVSTAGVLANDRVRELKLQQAIRSRRIERTLR